MAKRSSSTIRRIALSSASAQRLIRELVKDDGTVFFSHHAETRMRQRNVSRPQVLSCLAKGRVAEGPSLGIKGNWEVAFEHCVSGDDLRVVVALEREATSATHLLVITVIRTT